MSLFSRRLEFGLPDNTLTAAERRARQAAAGDGAGDSAGELLDLTVSNPTIVGLPSYDQRAAGKLAAALAQPSVVTYWPEPLGPPAARAAVAGEYARLGAKVDPRRVVLTASSSESYSLLFKLLCDPGDLVLVPTPSYPLFDFLARLEGVRTRPYRLAHAFGEWHLDWSSLDLDGARAVIVVSPNNPTGSFLHRSDHQRLAELCAERDLALIADEVFADYPLEAPATAVRTIAAEAQDSARSPLSFALGGLSKSCGLPQLKLGWMLVLGADEVAGPALSRLELIADTYLSVGTTVTAALPSLLALGAENRQAILARVRENRAALRAALPAGSPVSLLPAEGGWSAILRLPSTVSDEAWALALLEQDRVLLQPGYFFDLEGLGATVVLSLLSPPADLAEGMRRIVARAALSS